MKQALKPIATPSQAPRSVRKPRVDGIVAALQPRVSSELIIALSGPMGSGLPHVKKSLVEILSARGYDVVTIKITDLFPSVASRIAGAPLVDASTEVQRIRTSQDVGNFLRSNLGEEVAAELAIKQIATDRLGRHPSLELEDVVPERVAYVIDQLKHPKEAQLLRRVYGDLFFLIGVLCDTERRKNNLTSKMTPAEAEDLIQRDRAEADSMGQQLEKTLRLADFFVRYAHNNTSALKLPLERFASLIHGDNGITPTSHEVGMYAAFSASLKSACLSRQVGAAISDDDGNVLSSGCNDVPRSGGGLYEAGRATDHRCVFLEGGVCFNHRHKDRLRDEIAGILETDGGIIKGEARRLADVIREKTGLRDLIEFSRSVHAEMDAIVRIARTGGPKISGATLFTTTYPCHNCARHIVASGIKAVYFIEPYEKSLAKDLHSDSIAHEIDAPPSLPTSDSTNRVAFLHFEGVAPNRFATLFNQTGERKDSAGLAVKRSPLESSKKAPQYLDNYRQLEAQVIRHLQKINALEALPENLEEDAVPPQRA